MHYAFCRNRASSNRTEYAAAVEWILKERENEYKRTTDMTKMNKKQWQIKTVEIETGQKMRERER